MPPGGAARVLGQMWRWAGSGNGPLRCASAQPLSAPGRSSPLGALAAPRRPGGILARRLRPGSAPPPDAASIWLGFLEGSAWPSARIA